MKNTQLVEQAVQQYSAKTETDYAICITGEWGSGKSFFWKNHLKVKLEKGRVPSLYVSLYGVEKATEIDSLIYNAISSVGEDEGGVLASLAGNVDAFAEMKLGGLGLVVQFGLDKWKDLKLKESQTILLCFDDFERAKNLAACLAYINRISEISGTKVVVLANKDEIDWQNQDLANFNKTVRYSYEFRTTPQEMLRAAIGTLAELNHDHIAGLFNEYEASLVHFFEQSKVSNIRTITKAIGYFEEIYTRNTDTFYRARGDSIGYFFNLLATVILAEDELLDERNREKVMNPSITSQLEFEDGFNRDELGASTDKRLDFLISNSLYVKDDVQRFGIVSIVRNGFYIEEDFLTAFNNWRESTAVEKYLDTIEYWALTDDTAEKVFKDACIAVMTNQELTNPQMLAQFLGRVTIDVMRGSLMLDIEQFKSKFLKLVAQLYAEHRMDRRHVEPFLFEEARYCQDEFEQLVKLNDAYLSGQAKQNFPPMFWEQLAGAENAEAVREHFYKVYECPIFSSWESEEQVLNSLETFDNEKLLTLARSMGSRVGDPKCRQVLALERGKSVLIGNSLEEKYGQQGGVRAGHFKQISRLLKYQSVEYDVAKEKGLGQ
jgi:hypothetical protein